MPARNIAGPAGARPIALIGPMAVGKSAIGYQLAQRLGREFVDTDAVVVAAHGSIPGIFAARGERAFRDIEAKAVADAIEKGRDTGRVISLGGGAVLDSGTQQLLELCIVVYLEADADTVAARITRNTGRPLLSGDAVANWTSLFAARRAIYERLADIVLDVRHGTVAELAGRLEDSLHEYAAAQQEVEH